MCKFRKFVFKSKSNSKIKLWVAIKDGEIAGRIAGIINDNHNNFYKDRVGFFGFFENIDDLEALR